MTGPKHLWSGDWESESERTAANLPSAPTPEPEPEPQPVAARRWSRRQLAIALTTGVAAAAVTVGLVTTLSGQNKASAKRGSATTRMHTATNPQRPTGGQAPVNVCQQNPAACTKATPVVSGPSADWLGMQIVTSPAGIVISAIRPGSLADGTGFEPGDQLAEINGHHIDSVEQIRQDTSRIALGKLVTIEVLRAYAIPQAASVPMTERPTIHP